MKKKNHYLAALLFLCLLFLMPTGKSLAAVKPKIASVSTIYQTTTKITVKATAGYTVKLTLAGKTYKARSTKNGVSSFVVKKAAIGQKAVIRLYNSKNKAVARKTVTVKGKYAFKVTKYDSLAGTINGTGTAGKKVKVVVGGKTYRTTVAANGTWKIKVTLKTSKTAKISQQTAGSSYTLPKSTTLTKTKFNTGLIKKGKTYYSEGYYKKNGTWASLRVNEIIGNKMYFSYAICQRKADGTFGEPKTGSGVGVIKGTNTMTFTYMTGKIYGTFTWKNSSTIKVVGVDKVFTKSTRTEVLTTAAR